MSTSHTIPEWATAPRRRVSNARHSRLKSETVYHRPQGARMHRSSSTHSSPDLSERSSGESLPLWSDASSDSSEPLTPTTETSSDNGRDPTSFEHTATIDKTETSASNPATTKLLTQDPDILKQETGEQNESGARLIQKYCCGGGCCFAQKKPTEPAPASAHPLELPDNDAFRSLGLNMDPLYEELELSDLTASPESNISFQSIPVESRPKSMGTDKHPPSFVQPHPPYDVFSAPLYHARVLTKPGAEKKTFHFDIDVTDYPEESGVEFKTGGAIGVCPANYPEAVEDVFNTLGIPKFLRDQPVTLKTGGGRWPTIWGDEKPRLLTTTRRHLLNWCTDLQSYPPTKAFLRLLADHATAPNERKVLLFLTSSQGQSAFCNLRTGPHLTVPQLLHAFPSSKPPLDALLSNLNQLMPRFYSLSNDPHISSSRDGLANRRLIEVAVTIHNRPNWRTTDTDINSTTAQPQQKHLHGVGSGFLERLAKRFIAAEATALASGASPKEACESAQSLNLRIPMFRGLMANPLSQKFGDSTGPMMLIGAGVGMAPFRGFILNRLRNANCASKIWLVQGVRDSNLDELYSGELGRYETQIKKVVQSRAKRRLLGAEQRSQSETALPGLRRSESPATTGNFKPPTSEEAESRYVQDELRQQADVVWDVIRSVDGRVFVCGSSKGMGEGVERALWDVAVRKGGFDMEGARRFWDEQKEVGKYIAETW